VRHSTLKTNTGIRVFLASILLIIAAAAGCVHAQSWVKVRWVDDGDTIILQDGRRVRYIGIDAPEIKHPHEAAQPFSYAARAANRNLVEGRRLRLVYDHEKKDRYGRTLAYVYRSDGLFVNAELVRKGLAHVLYRFPNTTHAAMLLSLQRQAMEAHKGIWGLVRRDASPPLPYVGNRRSMRFHTIDCPLGKKIAPGHRVHLKNQWTAFWEGYAPAKGCVVFPPVQGSNK
jgi:micrococcal nuclease